MRLAPLLCTVLALAGCARDRPVVPSLTYVVGAPYQTGGVWRYPRESFTEEETGLAAIAGSHAPLVADGEKFDQNAVAAGHRTLQLPAIARITNLENGREVLARVNDRGPANPARLVELTRRGAELLGARDGTRIRLRVQEAESRQIAQELQAARPDGLNTAGLQVTSLPRPDVKAEVLPPPPGAASRTARVAAALPAVSRTNSRADAAANATTVPPRIPEAVLQGTPRPGALAIDCGSFGRPEYAEIMRAHLAGLGAAIATDYAAPRDRAYRVRITGLAGVVQAEAVLARALAAGVTDARIVVE